MEESLIEPAQTRQEDKNKRQPTNIKSQGYNMYAYYE